MVVALSITAISQTVVAASPARPRLQVLVHAAVMLDFLSQMTRYRVILSIIVQPPMAVASKNAIISSLAKATALAISDMHWRMTIQAARQLMYAKLQMAVAASNAMTMVRGSSIVVAGLATRWI